MNITTAGGLRDRYNVVVIFQETHECLFSFKRREELPLLR